MSDNEKETEIETKTETGANSQNADWEVVSLTASAYAASLPQADKSGHFIFPPEQHENLPIQTPPEEENQDDQENQETEAETDFTHHQEGEQGEEELIENEEAEREVKAENEKSLEREKEGGKEEREGIEWVKKRVSCFYKHVKEANAYWSVFVAATLVGLVILGHRWQREKTSSYQIKSGTNTARE